MKVLHVITDLDVGGAETMLAAMLTGERRDKEARVVSLLPGGEMRDRLVQAGVPVATVDMARGGLSPTGFFRLARIIKETRPDVVQSWMYHADLAAAAALSLSGRRRDTRLVWGIRCSDMDTRRYGWKLRAVIAACARISKMPDAIVANSYAGERVHRGLGYRARRFVVIPNGVDTARFRPNPKARAEVRSELGLADEAPVIAHVARVDPMKDHAGFLEALEELDGVTALAIGEKTQTLPHRRGLIRLGRRGDIPRLLAASDLVVSSSAFGEGFSNAIAEGMATGLPAVATNVGDAALIVARTGRVVPPGDPHALAVAIRELLDLSPAQRRALGARRRIGREFPRARTAERFAALYKDLV